MYTATVILAVVAVANAGVLPYGAGNTQAGNYGQNYGHNVAGQRAYGGAAEAGQAQGSQGSQGSYNFAGAGENAGAEQSAGRYDHSASLLAASEYTSAAAEQAGGNYGAYAGYGNAQGSQGSEGAQAAARQYYADGQAGYENAGANMGIQELKQATPIRVVQQPIAYAAPVAVQAGAYNAGHARLPVNVGGAAHAGYAGHHGVVAPATGYAVGHGVGGGYAAPVAGYGHGLVGHGAGYGAGYGHGYGYGPFVGTGYNGLRGGLRTSNFVHPAFNIGMQNQYHHL